jgi:hypothetical protein
MERLETAFLSITWVDALWSIPTATKFSMGMTTTNWTTAQTHDRSHQGVSTSSPDTTQTHRIWSTDSKGTEIPHITSHDCPRPETTSFFHDDDDNDEVMVTFDHIGFTTAF